MKILNTQSLVATVDAINLATFTSESISRSQRLEAAQWIVGRQGKPGSYANMFAPTERDWTRGTRLFTGERITTKVGTSHFLGQETCRALILLKTNTKAAKKALEAATSGMLERLGKEKRFGMYCCGTCSAALWRHLAVGGLAEVKPVRVLAAGIKRLKAHRDGKGRWRVFPFYYTLIGPE